MANNQNNFPSLMRRARWDRIGGVLVVFIILIVLIVVIARSCGKKKDPSDGLMYQTLRRGQYEFLCCACILRIIEETEEALE